MAKRKKPARAKPFRLAASMIIFAAEYPRDLNAKQAAIRAGLKPSHAAQTASHWLKRPEILELVEAGLEARRERCGIQVDRVLENLAATANADHRDYTALYGKSGAALNTLPAHVTYAIESVEFHENGTIKKLKLKDSHQALDLLVKYLRLIKSDDPRTGEGGDLGAMTPEQIDAELAAAYLREKERKALPDLMLTAVEVK